MEQKLISFEETEKQVDELAKSKATDLCGYYKIARPILFLIKQILPKKWRDIIESLMKYLDEYCGIQ
jgi:hypothetical protein